MKPFQLLAEVVRAKAPWVTSSFPSLLGYLFSFTGEAPLSSANLHEGMRVLFWRSWTKALSPFSLPWRSHGLVSNRNAAFLPLFLLLLCPKCSQEELWLNLSLSGTGKHLIAATSWFLWPPLKCLFPLRGSPQIGYLSTRDDYYGTSLPELLDQ